MWVRKSTKINTAVAKWTDKIKNLTEIARSQPQAAYTAFIKGYRSKFTYFMRTIPNFEDYMEPIEDILNSSLIPTLFGSDTPFPDYFTSLFSLLPEEGGLGIPLLKEEAREQYYGFSIITEAHVKSIIHQEMMFQQPGEDYQQKIHDYRAGKKPELKRRYRN